MEWGYGLMSQKSAILRPYDRHKVRLHTPSKHVKVGHNRPAIETPFEWRFASGPIVTRGCMLATFVLIEIVRNTYQHTCILHLATRLQQK